MTVLQAFSLAGQRAIVTGGGGALGSAMAEALCEAGAGVALVGRSISVDAVAARLGQLGYQAHAVIADLRDPAHLRRGFEEAEERLEGVDILVTSHGAGHRAPALEETSEAWTETVRLNLSAVFELCQLAGMRMVPRGRGKIINVASMTSFTGGVGVSAYAASKGGVAQLTKALANEWASHGVNVNALAPGYFRTKGNQHVWSDPERAREISGRIPAGRWGDPSDLKGAVVFLASPAAAYLHGVVLPVDGGWLSR